MTFEEWWEEAHGTAPVGDRNHLRDIGRKSVAEDAWAASERNALEMAAEVADRRAVAGEGFVRPAAHNIAIDIRALIPGKETP